MRARKRNRTRKSYLQIQFTVYITIFVTLCLFILTCVRFDRLIEDHSEELVLLRNEIAERERKLADQKQETELVQKELHEQKVANEKAPSVTMKRLGAFLSQ